MDFGDELELLLFLRERTPGERLRFGLIREGRAIPAAVVLGKLAEADRPKWQRNLEMARRKRAERASRMNAGEVAWVFGRSPDFRAAELSLAPSTPKIEALPFIDSE